MKKQLFTATLTSLLVFSSLSSAFAGYWQQEARTSQWMYQNEDGTFCANQWQWIDGDEDGMAECYYFDENGFCLTNTSTPDGYLVDENGAWIIDGIPQTQIITTELIDQEESLFTTSESTVSTSHSVSGISSEPYNGYSIIVNTNTHKYHVPSCSSVKTIKPNHLGYSSDVSFLNSNGYEPCKRCH